MKADISDIECFVNIVTSGSLSRAAMRHGAPKATLSYHLRRLEGALGVELFIRTGKEMRLTDAGKRFFNQCQDLVLTYNAALESVKTQKESLEGSVRIGATGDEFGTALFGPVMANLAQNHPDLHIELLMNFNEVDRLEDLPVDCFIYVGSPPDCDLMQRRVGLLPYGLFAGPGYLGQFGNPEHPDHLTSHQSIVCLRAGRPEPWRLARGREEREVTASSRMTVSNYWLGKYFAFKNLGIAYLPVFFVQHEVRRGALKAVLSDWQDCEVPVYVLFHKQRYQIKKIQAIIDSIAASFRLIQLLPDYALIERINV